MTTAKTKPRRSRGRKFLRFIFLWLPLLFVVISISQVVVMRWVDPFTSSFMIGRQVDAWLEKDWAFRVSFEWKDEDKLSRHLPIALVAAEDQKFPEHDGFDFEAMEKALEHNKKSKKIKGGSTISQQVAKNLFCWNGKGYMRYVRKPFEAWYTMLIEIFWPKHRIIEVYANIAEFGDGVYGAESAAKKFFGKSAKNLSANESARLAAVLPNPKKYSARNPGPYVNRRARWIQRQMRQLGGPGYLAEEPDEEAKPKTKRRKR
ncbi:MAG: monofunctional biosynthetic peptidoglycan transglycosylase [Arenimonas sp.]